MNFSHSAVETACSEMEAGSLRPLKIDLLLDN
jgi:hypothetical protein